MAYDTKIQEVPPQPTLSIREKISFPEISSKLGEFVGEVFAYLQSRGQQPSGPPFTRYHGFDGGLIDFEAGLPTAGACEGDGRIASGELPGGAVVSAVHMGSYETLAQAGEALNQWAAQNGREAAGPNWELYWVAPGHDPNPESWKTEVVKPLR